MLDSKGINSMATFLGTNEKLLNPLTLRTHSCCSIVVCTFVYFVQSIRGKKGMLESQLCRPLFFPASITGSLVQYPVGAMISKGKDEIVPGIVPRKTSISTMSDARPGYVAPLTSTSVLEKRSMSVFTFSINVN